VDFSLPDAIKNSSFQGVNDNFDIKSENVVGESVCETLFKGSLTLEMLGNEVVYMDSSRTGEFIKDEDLGQVAIRVHAILDDLVPKVAQALDIPLKNLPVMMVAVTNRLLGFTRQGGIFINLPPLKGMTMDATQQSVFLTLLHEIAHRSVSPHNTHFASLNSKLVFHCRKII